MKHGKNHAFAKAYWGNGHNISHLRVLIAYGCFLLVFGS